MVTFKQAGEKAAEDFHMGKYASLSEAVAAAMEQVESPTFDKVARACVTANRHTLTRQKEAQAHRLAIHVETAKPEKVAERLGIRPRASSMEQMMSDSRNPTATKQSSAPEFDWTSPPRYDSWVSFEAPSQEQEKRSQVDAPRGLEERAERRELLRAAEGHLVGLDHRKTAAWEAFSRDFSRSLSDGASIGDALRVTFDALEKVASTGDPVEQWGVEVLRRVAQDHNIDLDLVTETGLMGDPRLLEKNAHRPVTRTSTLWASAEALASVLQEEDRLGEVIYGLRMGELG